MDEINVATPTENVSSPKATQESVEVPIEITPANEFAHEEVPTTTPTPEAELPAIVIPVQPRSEATAAEGGDLQPVEPKLVIPGQETSDSS